MVLHVLLIMQFDNSLPSCDLGLQCRGMNQMTNIKVLKDGLLLYIAQLGLLVSFVGLLEVELDCHLPIP